jgi:Protein of unknown function (DUF3551)
MGLVRILSPTKRIGEPKMRLRFGRLGGTRASLRKTVWIGRPFLASKSSEHHWPVISDRRSPARRRFVMGPAPTRERELTSNDRACPLRAKNGAAEEIMRRAFWTLTRCRAAPVAKKVLMRFPALAMLAIATVLTAAPALLATPAWAQTYSPDYPVCLQTYGIDGNYIECGYTSLPQCAQSASGRAAQCIANPYFRSAQAPAGPHHRQHRRVY